MLQLKVREPEASRTPPSTNHGSGNPLCGRVRVVFKGFVPFGLLRQALLALPRCGDGRVENDLPSCDMEL